jgi:hypothetical protein
MPGVLCRDPTIILLEHKLHPGPTRTSTGPDELSNGTIGCLKGLHVYTIITNAAVFSVQFVHLGSFQLPYTPRQLDRLRHRGHQEGLDE